MYSKIIRILIFNFINRIRERFFYNLLSVFTGFMIIFYALFLLNLYSIIIVVLFTPYIIVNNLSMINKNINFAVLKDYPVTFSDIINILSFKFLTNNLISGLLIIFTLKYFFDFNMSEWICILFITSYISLILFFLIQLKIWKLFNLDMIFAITTAVIILISILILSLLYRISGAFMIVLSLLVVVFYHSAAVKIISRLLDSNVGIILEYNS